MFSYQNGGLLVPVALAVSEFASGIYRRGGGWRRSKSVLARAQIRSRDTYLNTVNVDLFGKYSAEQQKEMTLFLFFVNTVTYFEIIHTRKELRQLL